jgi:hypothetical protein
VGTSKVHSTSWGTREGKGLFIALFFFLSFSIDGACSNKFLGLTR